MAPDGAELRIGIVSYDTPEDLRGCLEALPAALDGIAAHIVVVDNGSAGTADGEVARAAGVELRTIPRNVGYPRAMNHALHDATTPFLLALNPDTVPDPGSLRHLVEVLRADPGIGLVTPHIVGPAGDEQWPVRPFPSPLVSLVNGFVPRALRPKRLGRRLWAEGHYPLDRTSDVDWTIGAVHLMRRTAVDRARPYSEAAFMFAEDMEICWHLHRNGWRVVFDPRVTVVHVGKTATGRDFGAKREKRWLDANYNWYVDGRGAAAARAWALCNALSSAAWTLGYLARGDREAVRHRAALTRFHTARVLHPRGDRMSAVPPGRDAATWADDLAAFRALDG